MNQDIQGYVIVGAPRTGSGHLCSLLTNTGVLGYPEEHLSIPLGGPLTGKRNDEAWAAILKAGSTPNGVFGMKLFIDHIDHPEVDNILARIAGLQFILLERKDLLGQAISWARAMQTSRWVSDRPEVAKPRYDRWQIDHYLQRAAQDNARWRIEFAHKNIDALYLNYEDCIAEPAPAVREIAKRMGVAPDSLGAISSDWNVQRDAINDAWRERFLLESRDAKKLTCLDVARSPITVLQSRVASAKSRIGFKLHKLAAKQRALRNSPLLPDWASAIFLSSLEALEKITERIPFV